ncbi:uncharacterized protein [Panulirus ornatus]|uniref:uncharacterized protein n=1 Tax=Panulirus ornatus TaxID=150431 RepID=UPI003A839875
MRIPPLRGTEWRFGYTQLRLDCPANKQTRFEKLLTLCDPVIQAAVRESTILRKLQSWSGPADIVGRQASNKTKRLQAWRPNLASTCDGSGLAPSAAVPQVSRRVTSETRLLTGSDSVKTVQVRAGTLPTPARTARGRLEIYGLCDTYHKPSMLGHVTSATLNWRDAWCQERANAPRGSGPSCRDLAVCSVKVLTWTNAPLQEVVQEHRLKSVACL